MQEWQTRISSDIESANNKLNLKLDVDTALFAYPYGEYTQELQQLIQNMGYFGIAQHSGAVGLGFDRLAVPRFPMAAHFANMERFAVSVNSRPLPVTDVVSGPTILLEGSTAHHQIEFTLLPGDFRKLALACYSNRGEKLTLEFKDNSDTERVVIQLPDWKAGRRKINCTAPSVRENGNYFWFSHQWLVKHPDGTWYEE